MSYPLGARVLGGDFRHFGQDFGRGLWAGTSPFRHFGRDFGRALWAGIFV